MTKDELKKLDELLAKEEATLTNQLNKVADKNPAVKGDYETRMPSYGDDEDENTHESTDLGTNFALEQELESRLDAVRKAREKIKSGTYGACANCGGNINPARLKAAPDAVLCMKCAR